jgi:hypothetical protein
MTSGISPAKKLAGRLAWRVALLTAISWVFTMLQQYAEVWWFPRRSAALAVRQLQSSDAAADGLRLFDWLHALLPTLMGAIVLTLAIVLLAPVVRAWISDRQEDGRVKFTTKGQFHEGR